MKTELTISSPQGDQTFEAFFHIRASNKDLYFDSIGFYLEHGKKTLEFPHHEVEILAPDKEFLRERKLHVMGIDDGRVFMCYPRQLRDVEAARAIFRLWALGSVFTMNTKIEFNDIHAQCGYDPKRTESLLKGAYGIVVAE